MKKKKRYLAVLVAGVLLATAVLSGCGQSKKEISKNDDHLTVYLWENRLMKNIVPYIQEQFPDHDIEFIVGNNDTDLYSYFEEHGELPDIITVRRFSGTDAQDLQPYLMDFASYDVVSRYYSYALQYYKNSKDEIQWLPICGIPQTIIANKTLFDQYGIKIPENYEEYAQACQQFYDNGIKPYSLDLALDVLDCMISEEGQKLIADGSGVISLNIDVPSMMEDVPGLEDEISDNSVYIRYSAQKSFDASLEAVHGLLSGEMDATQAYNVFRNVMNSKDTEEKATVNFEHKYSISLNDKNGRDAASSILTTIRKENDAQLAFAPYYYFTSSVYKGECAGSRVALMTAKSSDTSLYLAKINGKQIHELVSEYLTDSNDDFSVTDKYELPIASGMKIVIKDEENKFSLKDIIVNEKKLDEEKEYSILLTETTMSILKKINPECAIEQLNDTTLSSAWVAAMANGQQPSAPEDYIEVEK